VILATLVVGKADWLVTGDAALLALADKYQIATPGEFAARHLPRAAKKVILALPGSFVGDTMNKRIFESVWEGTSWRTRLCTYVHLRVAYCANGSNGLWTG
jgi:hypothetical protein